MVKVPELYKQYPFFDDGKYSPSRFYVASVVQIMTPEDAKKHIIVTNELDEKDPTRRKMTSLYDIWMECVESCKSQNIYPHDKNGYWCYAPKTDYFIVCAIPGYDENLIYFARHIEGFWFSFEVTGGWQSGLLDVEGKKFAGYKEDIPELYNKYKNLFNND